MCQFHGRLIQRVLGDYCAGPNCCHGAGRAVPRHWGRVRLPERSSVIRVERVRRQHWVYRRVSAWRRPARAREIGVSSGCPEIPRPGGSRLFPGPGNILPRQLSANNVVASVIRPEVQARRRFITSPTRPARSSWTMESHGMVCRTLSSSARSCELVSRLPPEPLSGADRSRAWRTGSRA